MDINSVIRDLTQRVNELESDRGKFKLGRVTDVTSDGDVVIDDEVTTTPVGGYLPEFNHVVLLGLNGRDPVVFPPMGKVEYQPPQAPLTPTARGAVKGITVEWYPNADPNVTDGGNTAGQYQVQISTGPSFSEPGDRLIDVTGTYLAVPDLTTGSTYYARVRARNIGGTFGPWSFYDDAVAGGVELEPESVKFEHIAPFAVTDAKIGNVSVGKLIAGEMTTQMLIGGQVIAGSPNGARVELNSGGLFAYRPDGVTPSLAIQSNTGHAQFRGDITAFNFRTSIAASGWIEMGGTLGSFDPVDEFRMLTRTSTGAVRVCSIRNPSSNPGGMLFSTQHNGGLLQMGFSSIGLYIAGNAVYGVNGTGIKGVASNQLGFCFNSDWFNHRGSMSYSGTNRGIFLTFGSGTAGIRGSTNVNNRLAIRNTADSANAEISASNFVTLSDVRLKTDIEYLETAQGMEDLRWFKPAEYELLSNPSERTRGLIAQDLPEKFRVKAEDGMYAVNPYAILTTLIAAVQNIDSRLSLLENI